MLSAAYTLPSPGIFLVIHTTHLPINNFNTSKPQENTL